MKLRLKQVSSIGTIGKLIIRQCKFIGKIQSKYSISGYLIVTIRILTAHSKKKNKKPLTSTKVKDYK